MTFAELTALAAQYLGSSQALQQTLPSHLSGAELAAISEHRYLSAMTKCVFRAGFVWRVIERKWPGFEEAFNGFNPLVVAYYSDEKLEELAADQRIIRNLSKIRATRDNAAFIIDAQRVVGMGFAEWIAQWPVEDIVGLWQALKKQGTRLGGNTGPGFLRLIGKDTFILTNDVTTALIRYGFIDKVNPSQSSLNRVQAVFNDFRQQSGRSLCEISKILAYTVNHRH